MAKLIYIASTSHSGSTLLDLVIGRIPEVFSAGEVLYLPYQLLRTQDSNWSPDKPYICTCLKSFKECKVLFCF
ncbi:MAG: hypothetical protein ACUZ8N_01440 [Candidatus Scalindua sp.]